MSFQVSAMFPHRHKALFCIPAPSACAHCTLYTWWAEHVMASQLWALFLSQSIALDCFHCFKLRCICALFPRVREHSAHQRDVGSTIPCSFQHLNHRCHSNTNTNAIQKCKHFLCLSCVTLRQLWFRSELFSLWNRTSSSSRLDEKPVRLWAFLHCVMWWLQPWDGSARCPISASLPRTLRIPHFTAAAAVHSHLSQPLDATQSSLPVHQSFLLEWREKCVMWVVANVSFHYSLLFLHCIGGKALQRIPLWVGRIRATALSLISQIFPQFEQHC